MKKTEGKEKLCRAMIRLMKKYPYEDISVKWVIAEAGVNRSTYYYHFKQNSDIVECLMDYIVDGIYQFHAELQKKLLMVEKINLKEYGSINNQIYAFLLEHRELYRLLRNGRFKSQFEGKLLEMQKHAFREWTYYFQDRDQELYALSPTEIPYYCDLVSYKMICTYHYLVETEAIDNVADLQEMVSYVDTLRPVWMLQKEA